MELSDLADVVLGVPAAVPPRQSVPDLLEVPVFFRPEPRMVSREEALPGRAAPSFSAPQHHEALDAPLQGPWPEDTEVLYVAMGCFWGAERIFWRLDGVVSTAAGYMGGFTPYPTYEEVCTGRTGHTEAVQVVYDPARIDAEQLLKAFWENHDPTTPNRQGNDVGTQYRSAIYWTTPQQQRAAEATKEAFGQVLADAGHGPIATELASAETEIGRASWRESVGRAGLGGETQTNE